MNKQTITHLYVQKKNYFRDFNRHGMRIVRIITAMLFFLQRKIFYGRDSWLNLKKVSYQLCGKLGSDTSDEVSWFLYIIFLVYSNFRFNF